MANFANREEFEKRKAAKAKEPALSSAEEVFKKATALHQQGDIFQALSLYNQIIERFPGSPRTDLAKTLVAGIQKEKIGVLWDAASDARSNCNPDEAIKLYNLIIEEFPDSPEATSAKTEITHTSEIQQSWNAGLNFQSEGNEPRAVEFYKHIVERYPHSPEAENAVLLMSIIHQNQFIPPREVAHDLQREENTPAKIISHLLTHKKATAGSAGSISPEAMSEEIQSKKIDKLWTQAVALDGDGYSDEASILYKKIIESSTNGHRVRDAKYRLEKIEARSADFLKSYDSPGRWGLREASANTMLQKGGGKKILATGAVLFLIMVGGLLFHRAGKPASWADVVDNAKKAVVVVKTADGAGSGFLVTADGVIITNASVVGKEKDVEVRLYSGTLKKATIVKVGTIPLDIAVLKIDGVYDQFLPMAGPDECKEGDEIRAIGAPLGIEYFITKGIISHCNHDRDGVKYLQTDTAMNRGNGGGPCMNSAGKVIGLSTSVGLGDDAQGLNLALPITVVKDFMDGKLVALEESLIKKEEEKKRELEQRNNKFYADADKTYRRLQTSADLEYANYTAKLDNLIHLHLITLDQGKLMAEQVRYAPSGSGTTSQWVQTLAFKVVKGEILEDDAIKLIKDHFKL
jgi:tetratricopeptide (TPR) repeat protein